VSTDRPRGNAALRTYSVGEGVRIGDLLVLAAQADPFNTGTPADVRNAVWFAEVHGRHGRRHLRRLHYLAVSLEVDRPDGLGTYVNTERCWDLLKLAARHARHLWRVDPEHAGAVDPALIVDERNPELTRYFAPRSVDPAVAVDVEEWSPWVLRSIVAALHPPLWDPPRAVASSA
jgi:hypothetical protein